VDGKSASEYLQHAVIAHFSNSCIRFFTAIASVAQTDPVSWVNLYIGTGSGPIGYGGTMPFVTPPFGMTDWTPQTRQNKLSIVSYKYEDTSISGFIGTHQPAIWMGDYGYVTLMPEIDTLKTSPEDRKLSFTHADEIVRPDYYSVWMDAGNSRRIRTEMTATERCAYMRFTFPANASSTVVVEASRPGIAGFAHVDAARQEITGYDPDRMDANLGPMKLPNFKGYFVVQFHKAFSSSGTYGPTPQQPKLATGAYAKFKTTEGELVEARVGTSFISIEQARQNLKAEIPAWGFEAVRSALRAAWNEKLGRIAVEGATDDQRRIAYTGLYHALLYPRIFSEQGRYYSAFDDTVHKGVSYTAYSIWDTFRAEQSLLTLMAPERIDGMIGAIDGDDDCGQMSAWYLFTALGFYPVNPASGDYMIGSPLFSKMTLRLANGNRFTVSAENNSSRNVYIQSATLNGRSLTIPVIHYDDIEAGASLNLVMGPAPSSWASNWIPDPLPGAAVQTPKD
jgi:predicted alpha-1,2-mannosidase